MPPSFESDRAMLSGSVVSQASSCGTRHILTVHFSRQPCVSQMQSKLRGCSGWRHLYRFAPFCEGLAQKPQDAEVAFRQCRFQAPPATGCWLHCASQTPWRCWQLRRAAKNPSSGRRIRAAQVPARDPVSTDGLKTPGRSMGSQGPAPPARRDRRGCDRDD